MRKYFSPFLPWILVIVSVYFNHRLKDTYFRESLPFVQDIQYGDFLVRKWPIVLVAILFLVFWVIRNWPTKEIIKSTTLPIVVIALVTFSVHFFSYERWFEFDDYRVIGTHHDVIGTPRQNYEMGLSNSDFYSIGMVYLVVRWFDTNFDLYNTQGLITYFFVGVVIYATIYQIQKNRVVALLVALFFVTSPTYYRQTLQMQEYIGDGFSTLLVAFSFFFLINKWYPSSVIFAAAALEFGLSRAHFVALPLVFLTLFRPPKIKSQKIHWVLSVLSYPILTTLYVPLFLYHIPHSVDQEHWMNNWTNFLRVADSVFAVVIPHEIIYPLITQLWRLTSSFNYTSIILGFLIIFCFITASYWLWIKKHKTPWLLFTVGGVMTVAAITMPTLSGIRVIYAVEPLTSQYLTPLPTAPTSYGIFSTFGMAFLIAGLGHLINRAVFLKCLIILIVLNSLMIIKSDREWAREYSTPQRATNPQLAELIPENGKVKIIYAKDILSRYVDLFYQMYRIKEPIYIQNDVNAFIELINKYKPQREDIYIFTVDNRTYKIADLSSEVRDYEGYLTEDVVREILKK